MHAYFGHLVNLWVLSAAPEFNNPTESPAAIVCHVLKLVNTFIKLQGRVANYIEYN